MAVPEIDLSQAHHLYVGSWAASPRPDSGNDITHSTLGLYLYEVPNEGDRVVMEGNEAKGKIFLTWRQLEQMYLEGKAMFDGLAKGMEELDRRE